MRINDPNLLFHQVIRFLWRKQKLPARRAGLSVPEFWLTDGHSRKATGNTGDYKSQGSYKAISKVIDALCHPNLKDLLNM